MKDGIYRVTANVGGQWVVAEAQVRNGVFQGLGALSGMVGVFDFRMQAGRPDGGDIGISGGVRWQRADLAIDDACEQARVSDSSASSLASDASLSDIRCRLDASSVSSDQRRAATHRSRMSAEWTWNEFHHEPGRIGAGRIARDGSIREAGHGPEEADG